MAGRTFKTDAELEADILAIFAEHAARGMPPPVLELVRERIRGAGWVRVLAAWKRVASSGKVELRGRKRMFFPAGRPGARKRATSPRAKAPSPYPLWPLVAGHLRRERRLRRWAARKDESSCSI